MPDTDKKTILVVDDDREIVRAISITLEREGYSVLKAYDGLEALDCVTSRDIHLIIIDVMMPRLDGLSAVMKIREKKNLPIIILSAKGEDSDKIIGLSMGADDYIAKPFNPMELVARVKSQLRRYTSLGDINTRSDDCIVNGRLTFRALCGRRAREADRDGDEDRGAFDEAPGAHLPRRGDLQPDLERAGVFRRKYGDGAHPPHPRENRDQSERAGISEGRLGAGL